MSQHTKKSDDHDERYAHVNVTMSPRVYKATVFSRLESDGWYAAVAYCAVGDEFSKSRGRTVARRKYFQQPGKRTQYREGEAPTYDSAQALAEVTAPGSEFIASLQPQDLMDAIIHLATRG